MMRYPILFLTLFLACTPSPFPVRFIPEMAPIPEEAWERIDPTASGQTIQNATLTYIQYRDQILSQITADQVRQLSRWAQTEMAGYQTPAFTHLTLQTTHIGPNNHLLIETVLDTLPSHNPLVTRQLKLYLVYNPQQNTFTQAIVTIRGWAEE